MWNDKLIMEIITLEMRFDNQCTNELNVRIRNN